MCCPLGFLFAVISYWLLVICFGDCFETIESLSRREEESLLQLRLWSRPAVNAQGGCVNPGLRLRLCSRVAFREPERPGDGSWDEALSRSSPLQTPSNALGREREGCCVSVCLSSSRCVSPVCGTAGRPKPGPSVAHPLWASSVSVMEAVGLGFPVSPRIHTSLVPLQ